MNLTEVGEAIGERLKRLREMRGISQDAFGAACKPRVTQGTVSQWESGRKSPALRRVMDWAWIFQVPAAYFLGEIELEEADLRGTGMSPVGEVDVEMATAGVSSYDPDEEDGIPGGLAELIESGMVMTARELRELRGYVDPNDRTKGARGAWRWPAQTWLDRLMEMRRREWRRKLAESQARNDTDEDSDAGKDAGGPVNGQE